MTKYYKFLIIMFLTFSVQSQDALLKRADSLYVHGNYSQAIEAFKSCENQTLVYEKMAKAYMAIGNYDGAVKNYESALNAFPENALLKYDYAKLLSRTKKYNDAAVLFNELIYLDYKNPNYHYEFGLVLEAQGDASAMNRFKSAFDLDHTHQKSIYKIAKQFLVKRHHDASLKIIDIGLQSYQNNLELINLKALNYYWKQDYVAASKWFEKLLTLGESSLFIHEKLSFCYAQNGHYVKAIFQAKQALNYDLKNATNLYILGQLYEKVNDYASAEEWLAQALEIMDQPLNVEYTALATALNHQNKHKEAIAALQKAVKENPQDQKAQFFLVRTKDEYYSDAASKIKVYEIFKQKFPDSVYSSFADSRLRELKNEAFMKSE